MVAGSFAGTVDFDPDTGITNLTSVGSDDGYVLKLDPNGHLIWVQQIKGSGSANIASIAIDQDDNIYGTGSFQGVVDFDPDTTVLSLSSAGGSDVFALKLDSSGNLVWAKQIAGIDNQYGQSLVIDSLGNSFITGYFWGTADFDPGSGIYNQTSNGHYDVFLLKLSNNGNFVRAQQIGGLRDDYGQSITIDSSGSLYVTGSFSGNVDFNPGPNSFNLTSNKPEDLFVLKLNDNGVFRWAKQISATYNSSPQVIKVDSRANVYTIGVFSGVVDFDPNSGINILVSVHLEDIFIQKLDSAGNYNWAVQMGNANYATAVCITIDNNDNIYTAGGFVGMADFDPGPNSTILIAPSSAYTDIFVHKLSQATTVGSVNKTDFPESLALYPNPTNRGVSLKFSSNQKLVNIRLYSAKGQLIETNSFSNTSQVNLEIDYPNAIYFLEVILDNNRQVFKVIKNNLTD